MKEFEITFSHPQIGNTSAVDIALRHIFGEDCTIEWMTNTVVIKTNTIEEIKDMDQLRGLKLKEELIKYSLTSFDDYEQKITSEYISEAEHQNGIEYWENFTSLDQLINDVKLYISSK